MNLSNTILISLIAISANVDAFSTPKPSIVSHKTMDSSLKFWKQKEDTTTQPVTKTIVQSESSKTNGEIDNGRPDFIAPSIYAAFTAALIFIFYDLRDAIVTTTLGTKALALVTIALIWDNLIIAIGSIFFKGVDETNDPMKYQILKTLSWPRFTLHAVGVPLQWITIAELGKAAGVGFLQSDLVQIGVAVAGVVVVCTSCTIFDIFYLFLC